jgi:hypothetical protein
MNFTGDTCKTFDAWRWELTSANRAHQFILAYAEFVLVIVGNFKRGTTIFTLPVK